MIQEVGVDVVNKRVLWVKARPDYKPQFSILGGLHSDSERRYMIESREAERNIYDIAANIGQESTGVEIQFTMSHNILTIAEEYIQ